ncbi:MAG: N-6 DNA methylase [Verrucomicrobia bacterium]|nr:N-6 DNA methylase [Verrucomicrobiota bacterium]
MSAPQVILDLVARFEQQFDAYQSGQYNETQVRREFLDPFFKALGWDMDNVQGFAEAYKDVIHEDQIRVAGATKAPDYCFRIGGTRKYFLEAKKPSVAIKDEPASAYQLRRYAWSAKLPLSILSDFEEFAVYDGRVKPHKNDSASAARIFYCTFRDYAEKWDWIYERFSREAVLKGAFDKFAESTRAKRGTTEVDAAFLETIEGWRKELAQNLALRNARLTQRELNFAVQRIIDRIIFLRICEDRGIEDYGRLRALVNGDRIYPRLAKLFEQADDRYNSGLFHFKKEPGRHEAPDELTLELDIDDKLLRSLLRDLYYPDSPYEFSVLSADILGQVYEQFLGKVIRLTDGHRAVVDDKPEVKKAGGVYYTPTYIVDYIVRQTVGKLLDQCRRQREEALTESRESEKVGEWESGKSTPLQPFPPAHSPTFPPTVSSREAARILERVSKLRILDPACGSGSFLIGAYQFLLDWHLQFYLANDPVKFAKGNRPVLVQTGKGWKLTIAERKRILLANIYGVDIDSQAVEVTKLSLLLKVLEGETGQTLQTIFRLFAERALPDLGDNIKCGNSLIGPDFYAPVGRASSRAGALNGKAGGGSSGASPHQPMLFQLTDDEKYRINVFDWRAEFPEIFRSSRREEAQTDPTGKDRASSRRLLQGEGGGGFDAVIGNPPYGAFAGEFEAIYFRAKYRSPANSLDTFLLFVERGHQLIRNQGLLGMIIPSGWVSAPSAKPLRNLFIESFKPLSFVSLPFDIFKAYIDTVVITAQRVPKPEREKSDVVQLFVFPSKFKIGSVADFAQFEKAAYYRDWLGSRHIEFLITCSRAETKILEKVRQQPRTLGDFVFVKRGMEVFAPQPTKSGLVNPKFAFTGVLQRFNLEHGEKGFVSYEAEVEASKPFEYFSAPRIMLRQVLSRKLRLQGVFTGETFLTNQSVQSLIPNPEVQSAPSLQFLLGILNSRLLSWYFVNFNSVARRDDFPKIIIQQTRELPLPDWDGKSDKALHDRIVKLVEQMLELHKQLAAVRTPQERTALERQIAATDTQIDRLVYDLYGLTEDEIKIVEGKAA